MLYLLQLFHLLYAAMKKRERKKGKKMLLFKTHSCVTSKIISRTSVQTTEQQVETMIHWWPLGTYCTLFQDV